MINLEFNVAAKNLGAKWDGNRWVYPSLAKAEFELLDKKYNQDLVPVEFRITESNRDINAWLGAANAQAICGYVLATALGRDSGARLADGVVVVNGHFSSGGSIQNYRCILSDEGVRVRCWVASAMIDEIAARPETRLVVLEPQEDISAIPEIEIQQAIKLLNRAGYYVHAKRSLANFPKLRSNETGL